MHSFVVEDEKYYFRVCIKKRYINVEAFDKDNFSSSVGFGLPKRPLKPCAYS
jgi:hypothetical protein